MSSPQLPNPHDKPRVPSSLPLNTPSSSDSPSSRRAGKQRAVSQPLDAPSSPRASTSTRPLHINKNARRGSSLLPGAFDSSSSDDLSSSSSSSASHQAAYRQRSVSANVPRLQQPSTEPYQSSSATLVDPIPQGGRYPHKPSSSPLAGQPRRSSFDPPPEITDLLGVPAPPRAIFPNHASRRPHRRADEDPDHPTSLPSLSSAPSAASTSSSSSSSSSSSAAGSNPPHPRFRSRPHAGPLGRPPPAAEGGAADRHWTSTLNDFEMSMVAHALHGNYDDDDDPDFSKVKEKFRVKTERDTANMMHDKLSKMSYHERRKHERRFHNSNKKTTSLVNKREFLMVLAQALVTFGAPSHNVESELKSMAGHLDISAEFTSLPGHIECAFKQDDSNGTESFHFHCNAGIVLGKLHRLHLIYKGVWDYDKSARDATEEIRLLLDEKPLRPTWFKCFASILSSFLISILAFGGSVVDGGIAAIFAGLLFLVNMWVSRHAKINSKLVSIVWVIIVSFCSRLLSGIPGRRICYIAVSYSSIISLLPGFLILTSSLELASKNKVSGGVKMVNALIYTLFLGVALQMGSDFYSAFKTQESQRLAAISNALFASPILTGSYLLEKIPTGAGIPLVGSWSFVNDTMPARPDIVDGCYRPANFPWFLQPAPKLYALLIVPVFATIGSLANDQPIKGRKNFEQLCAMVLIACASYAANAAANHYIFTSSDIVSAIGAFTIGCLGNIYSRWRKSTALAVMITGVLFLVPSGLSASPGGLQDTSDSGMDIGQAMIQVSIGITVGLFMSKVVVSVFGKSKTSGMFTF